MTADAMIVTADEIRFNWTRGRRFRAYVMAVAADNLGKLYITESLSSLPVRHRPHRDRPGKIDFGFQGYSVYQRTGGLPDIVVFSLLVIRDRRALRKAGEILKRIAADSGTKTAITGAAVALGASTAGVSAVAAAVAQVAGVIGKAIAGANDKSLGEAMGTIVVPENRSVPREEDTIEGTNFDVDMDYFLFDAARDEDSEANLGVHIEVDSQGKFQLVE